MDKEHTRPRNKTRNEVLEILKAVPDLTCAEIHELMPHVSLAALTSMISNLKAQKVISVTGRKFVGYGTGGRNITASTYAVSNTPRQPSDAALSCQIEELTKRVAELQAWKDAAIVRFPDLAVSENVLRARKLVASELREGGDHNLAEQVLLGNKDNTALMRVTVRALEESN